MNNSIIERIQREAGAPELIDVLVERLNPKERLLISGLGSERFCSQFRATTD